MDQINSILDDADRYLVELPDNPPLFDTPKGAEIAAYIDHTLLKPDADESQINTLCQEARQYNFASVCVNPVYTHLVSDLLHGSQVKVCTVIGFPLGASQTLVKVLEGIASIQAGACELDMVVNIGAIKSGAFGKVYNDIQLMVQAAHNCSSIVKVILEMALLTKREKIISCLICKSAGADYVNTATGFGPGGALLDDVELMYHLVGPEIKIKASGGIKTYADALAMIKAGASRIGASVGLQIIEEAKVD